MPQNYNPIQRLGCFIASATLGAILPFAILLAALVNVRLDGVIALYSLPFVLWNIGFWPRLAAGFGKANLSLREYAYFFVGIPSSSQPVEMTGSLLQIAAWLLTITVTVITMFVPDRLWRGAIVVGVGLPLLWAALGLVKLLRRTLD